MNFQLLIDKIVVKLISWLGKHITMAGRYALIKSVLTSQVIYHLTSSFLPRGTINAIIKLLRGFLWVGTNKMSRDQCKIGWDIVCRPTNHGGLGILDLDKFVTALRLRWP